MTKVRPQPLDSQGGRPTRARSLSAARFGAREISTRPFLLPPPWQGDLARWKLPRARVYLPCHGSLTVVPHERGVYARVIPSGGSRLGTCRSRCCPRHQHACRQAAGQHCRAVRQSGWPSRKGTCAGRRRRYLICPAADEEGEQGFRREAEEGSYEKGDTFIHSICPGEMFPDHAFQLRCFHRMRGVR